MWVFDSRWGFWYSWSYLGEERSPDGLDLDVAGLDQGLQLVGLWLEIDVSILMLARIVLRHPVGLAGSENFFLCIR